MWDKPGLLVLLIGIYPHLLAISLDCLVWVYPTLEEGDPRSKMSKPRNTKHTVAVFVVDIVLKNPFGQV